MSKDIGVALIMVLTFLGAGLVFELHLHLSKAQANQGDESYQLGRIANALERIERGCAK